MGRSKIEWCDITVNPVIGCARGCEYCYAKRLNDRFKWVKDFSKPVFFPEKLKQIEKIKNKVIFMNSMSDIYFWGYWYGKTNKGIITKKITDYVNEAIKNNTTNTYIFLTKFQNKIYIEKSNNVLFGLTKTNQENINAIRNMSNETLAQFDILNLEPLHSNIDLGNMKIENIKLAIIGAETGNRKDKVIPKREWIENIVKQLKERGYTGKIFMKNNLKDIYPDIELIQEFPFDRSK